MRVVVRNGVSMDLIDLLLDDMRRRGGVLRRAVRPDPTDETRKAAFHH